jgi:hypothetical protein
MVVGLRVPGARVHIPIVLHFREFPNHEANDEETGAENYNEREEAQGDR